MNTAQIPPDTTQTFPKQPPDISRELKMKTDSLSVSVGVCCHLSSVVVYLEFPGDVWVVFGGCLGVSETKGVFEGYLGSQSLQYRAKTLFRHSLGRYNFCHLTILRH